MSYYCDICDKTIKHKCKNKHLKSITHNELEKSIHIILLLTIQNFSMSMIYITILLTFTIKKYYF